MVITIPRGVRLLAVMFFMVCLGVTFLMLASPAFADVVNPDDPAAPVTVSQLTPQMVAGLIGSLVPLLVSLLARWNASPAVKAIINLALTAILGATAALVVPVDGNKAEFGWVPFLTAWLFAFVTSVIAYEGALKNFSVNDFLLQLGGIFGQKVPTPVNPPVPGEVVVPPADVPPVPPQDDIVP